MLIRVFALSLLPGVAVAQDVAAPEAYASARATIQRLVADGDAPAIAVAVYAAGKVVWAEGFGLADRARGHAATADSIFRLASISKPFTATLLMRFVERGALDLDAPVNRYLAPPGVTAYRGDASAITLRRLANHTAGLPTHWSFFYAGSTPPGREVTIARYGFAAWEPGTRSNYSNLAFGILDHVLARAGERSYRELLVAEVLDALGMTHTDVGVRPGTEKHAAEGYVTDVAGRFVPVVDYGFDHDGASAVRSSARDLMRFAAMHLGDGEAGGVRVLGASTARAMREPTPQPAGNAYGVAWNVGRERGTAVVRHSGGMPGVSTALELYPERGAAIAVLTNCSDRGATRRALTAIQAVLLGEELAAAPAAGPPPAPAPTPTAPTPDATPAALAAGHFRGHVVHHDGAIPLELTLETDGTVRLQLGRLDVRRFERREVRADRIELRCQGFVPESPAFHGTPTLDFELDAAPDGGFGGVLYVTGDATFRLPHWVVLAPSSTSSSPPPPARRRNAP